MESKCLNSEKCYYDYESTECKNARALTRALTGTCFRGKVLKEVNDFSKVEIGQKLYSLYAGIVTVKEISNYNIICKSSDGTSHYWGLNGILLEGSNLTQDLYWHKPEIEFQPDPVQKVKKVLPVFVHYISDNAFSVCMSKNSDDTIPATITFEVEE